MSCQPKSSSIQAILKLRPRATESADKPKKKGLRWNKASGLEGHDGGTVDEAGTSNPSGMRGCQREVREELKGADLVSVKVDAASERVWRLVDRPDKSLSFKEVIEGLKQFCKEYRGTLLTETMLVDKVNYSEEAEELAALIAQLGPKKAYVAVPTRPPAESWVKPASEPQINAVFQAIQKRVRDVEFLLDEETGNFGNTGNAREDLLGTLAVHPMREEAVNELLKKDGAGRDALQTMLNDGEIIKLSYAGKTFYMKKISSRDQKIF